MQKFSDKIRLMLAESIKLDSDLCLLFNGDSGDSNLTAILFKKDIVPYVVEYDYEKSAKYVMSCVFLRYNGRHKCYEIDSIVARDGFGPTMVLMLVNWSKKGLIMNVTEGKVSDEAKSMWMNFSMDGGKGREYVDVEDIETDHPEDFLNKKLFAKKRINLKPFLLNSKKAIGKDPYQEIEEGIQDVAETYLDVKMRELYR